MWEELTATGAILRGTGIRLDHERFVEMLGPGPKAHLIDDLLEQLGGDWFSFWHDAQYILRSVRTARA